MQVDDLRRLYEYNYWANSKLLGAASQLTPEQFTQEVAGSYGSVRNTLVHVLSAEWGWLERCGGHPRGERLQADAYPTFQSLTDEWKRVEGFMREFLSQLTDKDLARKIEYAFGPGPTTVATVGDLMQHAALHAVHHRGQVALLLRAMGVVPGNFDYLLFASV